jgi:hypothetical protein
MDEPKDPQEQQTETPWQEKKQEPERAPEDNKLTKAQKLFFVLVILFTLFLLFLKLWWEPRQKKSYNDDFDIPAPTWNGEDDGSYDPGIYGDEFNPDEFNPEEWQPEGEDESLPVGPEPPSPE